MYNQVFIFFSNKFYDHIFYIEEKYLSFFLKKYKKSYDFFL